MVFELLVLVYLAEKFFWEETKKSVPEKIRGGGIWGFRESPGTLDRLGRNLGKQVRFGRYRVSFIQPCLSSSLVLLSVVPSQISGGSGQHLAVLQASLQLELLSSLSRTLHMSSLPASRSRICGLGMGSSGNGSSAVCARAGTGL